MATAPRANYRKKNDISVLPTVNDIAKANSIKIEARNERQVDYIRSIKANTLTIALGPAGTAKTYIAAAVGADMLLRGAIKKFIIARPAVALEGEEHGFLPGDLRKKLAPWARPVTDKIEKLIGKARFDALMMEGKIEALPFTYLRGLELSDAFVFLDESQNTTVGQMKAFTTRFGENLKIVIAGDVSQTDMKGNINGLSALSSLIAANSIPHGRVEFGVDDIERSALAKAFVKAWEVSDAA